MFYTHNGGRLCSATLDFSFWILPCGPSLLSAASVASAVLLRVGCLSGALECPGLCGGHDDAPEHRHLPLALGLLSRPRQRGARGPGTSAQPPAESRFRSHRHALETAGLWAARGPARTVAVSPARFLLTGGNLATYCHHTGNVSCPTAFRIVCGTWWGGVPKGF